MHPMIKSLRTASQSSRPARHRRLDRALAVSTLALACAGGRVDSEAQVASVGYVAVLPGSATLSIGDSLRLDAVVLGTAGDTLRNVAVAWRSANSTIAQVTAGGYVRALAPGLAGITAETGGRVASARVIVVPAGTVPRVAANVPPSASRPAVSQPPTDQPVRSEEPPQRPAAARPRPQQEAAPPAVPTSDVAVRRRADGAAHPNEPPGFRPLADRAFLTKAKADDDRGDKSCRGGSECWDGLEYRYNKFSVIEDRSAPFSCCTIARMHYAAGHRSGTAPATVQTQAFRPPVEELYVSIWARLSPNWVGNQSGTNKMFFLGIGRNANNIFLSAEGSGRGALQPQIRLQGVPDERRRLRPNLTQTTLTRGRWQHWEFYFKMNTPGGSNGIAKMWLDGAPVTDERTLAFRGPAEASARWWIFHWSPTYGGGGAPPPDDQYLDFDHVYVSGR
jgi:hypothetical protein